MRGRILFPFLSRRMKHSETNRPDTGTWNQSPLRHGVCHPEVEYFMVDYFDQDHCAHIRLPFLRQEQVFEVCNKLQVQIKSGASIRAIRILPEAFLDEPYCNPDIVEEAIAAGIKNANFLGASTRAVLFSSRYEAIAKSFKSRALRSSAG